MLEMCCVRIFASWPIISEDVLAFYSEAADAMGIRLMHRAQGIQGASSGRQKDNSLEITYVLSFFCFLPMQ